MVMSSPFHRLARAFAPYLRRWLCGLASGGSKKWRGSVIRWLDLGGDPIRLSA